MIERCALGQAYRTTILSPCFECGVDHNPNHYYCPACTIRFAAGVASPSESLYDVIRRRVEARNASARELNYVGAE